MTMVLHASDLRECTGWLLGAGERRFSLPAQTNNNPAQGRRYRRGCEYRLDLCLHVPTCIEARWPSMPLRHAASPDSRADYVKSFSRGKTEITPSNLLLSAAD